MQEYFFWLAGTLGEIMESMTEEEAFALDEYYTNQSAKNRPIESTYSHTYGAGR